MTETSPDIRRGSPPWWSTAPRFPEVNHPETNSLLYRGYLVQGLAASCGFEDVAWLLWHADLTRESNLRKSVACSARMSSSCATN